MSQRKLRSDAGKARGPRTSERKTFIRWMINLSAEEQASVLEDIELINDMMAPLRKAEPKEEG